MSDAAGGGRVERFRVDIVFSASDDGISATAMANALSGLAELMTTALQVAALPPELLEQLSSAAAKRAEKEGGSKPPWDKEMFLARQALDRGLRARDLTLPDIDDVLVLQTTYASPWQVALLVGGAITAAGPGIWALVQAVEKALNIPENRRKLKEERRKIELEVEKLEQEVQRGRPEYEEALRVSGLQQAEIRALETFQNAELEPTSVRIRQLG
jgi:hypothetical protein